MKKILILGLLLVSHLWGLKKWDVDIYSNREEWCLKKYPDEASRSWCETKTPTLPNDYKPTKEDKVLKVKVGNVEGEIVGVEGKKALFIRSNGGNYEYVEFFSNYGEEPLIVNYPNYAVMMRVADIGVKGNKYLLFYQILRRRL